VICVGTGTGYIRSELRAKFHPHGRKKSSGPGERNRRAAGIGALCGLQARRNSKNRPGEKASLAWRHRRS